MKFLSASKSQLQIYPLQKDAHSKTKNKNNYNDITNAKF